MTAALVRTLLVAWLATATPAATPATAPDAPALTKLLTEFLDGASHDDAAIHERFWADELVYTGSGGRRIGKAQLMKEVREAPAPRPEDPVTRYTAEDVRVQQYGTSAIVAFELVATTTTPDSSHVARYLNTGFFVKRHGLWQAAGWQATKKP